MSRICTVLTCLLLLNPDAASFAQTTSPTESANESQPSGEKPSSTDEPQSEPSRDPEPPAEPEGEPKPDADAEANIDAETEVDPEPAKPTRPPSPLATTQWRGRTPRWIGLYGSQLADLIPESFRPISIEDLATALRENSQTSLALSDVPVHRLVIAACVQSDRLVSLDSRLILPASATGSQQSPEAGEPIDDQIQRYPLGPINFSLFDPATAATRSDDVSVSASGRIVSDAWGNCYAIGTAESTIPFGWSARCKHLPIGSQWTLRLPNATITQFYVRVHQDERIHAAGGVATRLSEPPSWEELGIDPDRRSELSEQAESDKVAREDIVDTNWYCIEPTPGQPLVLTLTTVASADDAPPPAVTVVRGCRMQAQWMGDQLRWTCLLTIDAGLATDLPALSWVNGEVTAVQRDNMPVPFEWTGSSVRFGDAEQVAAPSTGNRSGEPTASTSSLLFEGISTRQGELVSLPRPLLPSSQFLVPPQTWQLQLEIPNWSTLSEIRLPVQWNIKLMPSSVASTRAATSRSTSNDEESADSDLAKPNDQQSTLADNVGSMTSWIASGPMPTENDPWSLALPANDALVFAGHQVRFEMDETSVGARGKVTVEMPRGLIRPITLELQDGFQFDFIGVGDARRSVPTGAPAGRGRRITIWPGSEEVVNDRVVIHVTARARRNGADESAANNKPDDKPANKNPAGGNRGAAIRDEAIQRVGSMWLARTLDCPGQLLATIIPPANLSWSAKAAIEPSRLPFLQLSADERRFFAPLPGDAIVFGGAIEATPEITLEKPDINLSVSLRTLLGGVPSAFDDTQRLWTSSQSSSSTPNWSTSISTSRASTSRPTDQVWQTLELKTEGTAGAIGTIRLRFAAPPVGLASATDLDSESTPAEQLPSMQWFVQLQTDQPLVAIDETSITQHFIENARAWEVRIVLPAQFTNQSLLIGRRQHTLLATQRTLALGLPNVPDAASQAAEVWIDSTLQLHQHLETLKGAPPLESKTSRLVAGSSTSSSRRFGLSTSITNTARYRYDPNDQPWIEIAPRQHQPPAGLIVGQRLTAVGSISGTDSLRMSCLTRSADEIMLTFPPSLHLNLVRRDGVVVTPRVLPGVGVVIPAPEPQASALPKTSNVNVTAVNAAPLRNTAVPRWTKLEASWVLPSPRSRWYRWYEFPQITMDQLLIDARQDLVAATDTSIFWIPNLLGSHPQSHSLLLISSGLLSGLGWVAALMLLGLARLVDVRGLSLIAAGVVSSVVAAMLWPAATLPLITFVAVPLTLAALQLSTAVYRRESGEWVTEESHHSTAQTVRPPVQQTAPERRQPQVRSDSWTRRFEAGEIMSSEVKPDSWLTRPEHGDDSASIDIQLADDDSETDFSSSSILPILLALAFTLTGSVYAQEEYDQEVIESPKATTASQSSAGDVDAGPANSSPPTIDVLVPLRGNGELLGNKIYIPEAFYNELFFSDTRLPLQTPLIQEVIYRLRLKSPLQNNPSRSDRGSFFNSDSSDENQPPDVASDLASLSDETIVKTDAVSLEAAITFTLPGGTRRLRLPYRVEHVVGVQQPDSDDELFSLRWGKDSEGWVWAETLTPENSSANLQTCELVVSLRCNVRWESPWVVASIDLPALPAAALRVSASDNVHSVMMQSPTSSWLVDTNPTASAVQLGPLPQLNLRYRFENSDDNRSAALPWQDSVQWQQRFWVHSQSGKTVIQCELQPRQMLPPEAITALTITSPEVTRVTEEVDTEISPDVPLSPAIPTQLLGTHWSRLPSSKSVASPTVRLRSLRTPTRPIRLGWTVPTPSEGVWRIQMPKISFGNTVGADQDPDDSEGLPWIAWTFADDVQPDWSQVGELEPLAVDQFYAKWTGYLSSINRAAVGAVQDVTLRRVVPRPAAFSGQHAISIDNDAQRVRFLATITPTNDVEVGSTVTNGATRYAITLPTRGRLLDWRFIVDGVRSSSRFAQSSQITPPTGQLAATEPPGVPAANVNKESDPKTAVASLSQPWTVHRKDEVTTLFLTTDQTSFQIEIDALVPHASGGKPNPLALLSFRKITVEPEFEQTHELQLTRHVDTIIKWDRPIQTERVDAGVDDAASLLATGEVLLDRFKITGPLTDTFSSARFRTLREKQTFDVDSRITLRWEEGRWMAQTDCEITSKHCPDYIDIAMPTRWCDSLQIDPLCVSSRQPTLDPALQVLRLQLRDDKSKPMQTRQFRLLSRLAVSEITRVSVPEVRIIGAKRHRIDVIVPTRLTNEQVRWRSNFAGPIEKPRWRVQTPKEDENVETASGEASDANAAAPTDTELSVYAITSPGWSIDLETLPRTDRLARLIHADHRVLVRPLSEDWLIVSRFDVLPGDQSSLQLSVAGSAELLGVWVATRGADLRLVSSISDAESTTESESIWEVSLPLSRLSQTVEVLTSFRKDTSEILLPALAGLTDDEQTLSTQPMSVNWCEIPTAQVIAPQTIDQVVGARRSRSPNFYNDAEATAWVSEPISASIRTQWLASSVVQAIRASSDALADRRDEEVAIWLQPWIVRYRLLCDTAERSIGASVNETMASVPPTDSEQKSKQAPPGLLSWGEMDAFILAQETRYFADDSFTNDTSNASMTDLNPRPPDSTAFASANLAAGAYWNAVTAWSDFLAVGRPPGFADRWTFATTDRKLPVRLLTTQRPPLNDQTRQAVTRGGLFIALACFVFLAAFFPRRRMSFAANTTAPTTWQKTLINPSLWLFVLGLIGLLLLPLPIAFGLMAAALILATNSKSGRWFRWPWRPNSRSHSSKKAAGS